MRTPVDFDTTLGRVTTQTGLREIFATMSAAEDRDDHYHKNTEL